MTAPHTRHDGWTPDRTARFLDTLSHKGNVRAASAAIGLSRETAYKRRRRDPLFARGWAAAMLLAREEGGHILADRALEGVEEDVWFRGERVGTRRRYDNRLLLAHITRLDRLALDETAQADAGRFDELLACLAGAQVPEVLAAANDDLPPDRARFTDHAAEQEADRQEEEAAGGFGEDAWERERRESAERIDQARASAGTTWDAWQHQACTHVDTLILPATGRATIAAGDGGGACAASADAGDIDPRTVSDLSTSPLPTLPVAGLPEGAGKISHPVCTRPAILRPAQVERDGRAGALHDPGDAGTHADLCPDAEAYVDADKAADAGTSPGPLVLSLSRDAGTAPGSPRPGNRAERRRRGRKSRPAVPATTAGRLQARG